MRPNRVGLRQATDALILDFDIESRPLSWYGGDFVTKETTAIAAKFISDKNVGKAKKMYCWALGEVSMEEMLEGFRKLYDKATIVTGHYIRGYDLPSINAGMLELGLPPLASKMTQDTKGDLIQLSGLSKSQENLGATLGLKHPKIGMDQDKWRKANRLEPAGIAETKKRVRGDVEQHIELRQILLERGLLSEPRLWRSTSAGFKPGYHA